MLCSPSDNRDPEEKEVWFEADRNPLQRTRDEVLAAPEPESTAYDPAVYDATLAARVAAPLITFPDDVVTFGVHHLPDDWHRLSGEARDFLCSLSCRFMPFVQVLPRDGASRVRGFELLASGSRGEVYAELMREARQLGIGLGLLDVILMLVEVLTVQELRLRTTDRSKLSEVFFSLNLSPPLMAENCRLARAVIRLFDQQERDILRFELTEKFRAPEVQALAGLFAEFSDLKFAVDDANDHHLMTAARLEKYASFTKLSHRYVQDVLRVFPESPEAGLRALLKHGLPPKPHVLEGVEDLPAVLQIFGDGDEKGLVPQGAHIFAQGFDCSLDAYWGGVLEVPPGMGWRGQFVLPIEPKPKPGAAAPEASPRDAAVESGPVGAGRSVEQGLWRFDAAEYYRLRGRPERDCSGHALDGLIAWAAEPGAPLAYLLGDYGAGKTFTARMLCNALRHKLRAQGWGRAPLYVDLRDVPDAAARSGNLQDVLRTGSARLRLEPDVVAPLSLAVSAGQVLLVFDGLDEKAGHLSERGALQRFRRVLHSAAVGNAKVLIVSRLAVFPDTDAQLRETRLEPAPGEPAAHAVDARLFELLPLAPERAHELLSRFIPGEELERTMALIRKVYHLEELASRPLVLRWIADRRNEIAHLASSGANGGRACTAAAGVYGLLVRDWLARDEEKSVLVPELKLTVMERLALESWRSTGHCLPPREVQRVVIAEVNAFYGGAPPSDPARAGLADVRAAAFLTRDDAGNCRFAHASLLEYFLARHLAARLRAGEPDALSVPALSRGAALFLAGLAEPSALSTVVGENADLVRAALP